MQEPAKHGHARRPNATGKRFAYAMLAPLSGRVCKRGQCLRALHAGHPPEGVGPYTGKLEVDVL